MFSKLTKLAALCLFSTVVFAQAAYSGPSNFSGPQTLGVAARPPLLMGNVTPPGGTVSTIYGPATIPVTGGIPPYACALTSGTLPLNVTVSTAPGNAGCLLGGTLTAGSAGTYANIVITATDSASSTVSNSPAYSITILTPKGCGPPTYPCSITSLATIQLPVSIPAMGTNTCPGNPLPCYPVGAGTVIADSSFNASTPSIISRATDSNTVCAPHAIGGFGAAIGGAGNVNTWSSDDSMFEIEGNNGGKYILAFNPSTYVATGLYTSAYSCANGGKGLLNVPAGEFSYVTPKLFYGFQTSSSCATTTCITQTSLTQWDLSGATAPTSVVKLFDFANCLPSNTPAPSWSTVGGSDVTDRYFAEGASVTGGGQGTGGNVFVWDSVANVCYMYDTIGNFDSSRTAISITGSAATYVKATQAVTITVPNSFTAGQILYMIGITGAMNPLNGYAIALTAGTSGTQIQGTLTGKLGHADVSGTIGGPSCSGTPLAQCANIGTIHAGIYSYTCTGGTGGGLCTGGTWTQSFIGYVSPVPVVGAAPSTGNFTIHNAKIGKDGTWIVIAHQVCLSTCANNLPQQYWQVGTTTVHSATGNFGHWDTGNNVLVGSGASSQPFLSWNVIQFANPPVANPKCSTTAANTYPNLCLVAPVPQACSNTILTNCIFYDSHPSWATNNPTFRSLWGVPVDQTPMLESIYPSQHWTQGLPFPGPYANEIDGINTCYANGVVTSTCSGVGNPIWRFGHTYNTALSSTFDVQFAISNCSQTGKFCSFASDWQGTLGQAFGTTTGCTGGIDLKSCRGDVFVMVLQ